MPQPTELVSLLQEGFILVIILAAPVLAAALMSGIVVSAVQAFTKSAEPSVPHVIRVVSIGIVLAIASPWMAGQLQSFAERVWSVVQIS